MGVGREDALKSLASWEKREHGKCEPGHHLPYRTRAVLGTEVRCKLCYMVTIERRKEEKAA